MSDHPNKVSKFWEELNRRRVVRVITVYAAVAFVILELVSIIVDPLRLPEWTLPLVIILICVGFVIAIVLSWIYDITPEGLEKTKPVTPEQETIAEKPAQLKAWKVASYISFIVIVGLIVLNLLPRIKVSAGDSFIGKSIAVLPFTDMSLEQDQEYFCDGITEEIINSLTQVDELKVIARTSSFSFKGKNEDIREIGDKLGVDVLVEGSIQKIGNQIRITAQLIKVEDGSHIWSNRYDRELEDVFAIQDEISYSIVQNLKVKLLGDLKRKIENRHTENLEAYTLYLKGRYFWNKRTERDLIMSIQYYTQAIELDSTYALAYAGLADTYFIMAWWNWLPIEEGIQRGKEFALKALSIDNSIAEAHATLGALATWYDLDWSYAESEFKQAISLNPNNANAFQYYSELLDILGRNREARDLIEKAIKLNPHSQVMYSLSAMYYYHNEEFEKSIEESKKSLEISYYGSPVYRLIKCYACLGMVDDLNKLITKTVAEDLADNNHEILENLSMETEISLMIRYFIEWISDYKSNDYLYLSIVNYRIASLYGLIGDSQKSIEFLKRSIEAGEPGLLNVANNPDFVLLRDNPWFKSLLLKMNLHIFI